MSRLPSWLPAYVGLGSNLGDPPAQLRSALAAMERLPATRLVATSAFYRNPPFGLEDQPHFVNAVAGLLTQLPAAELLAGLKSIELALGRRRDPDRRWGPRVIDLDLLVVGRARASEAALTLPHPGIVERNFVLFPLIEIAPGLDVPGLGAVADLAARLERTGLERID